MCISYNLPRSVSFQNDWRSLSNTCLFSNHIWFFAPEGNLVMKTAWIRWSHPEYCIISSRLKLSPNQFRPCLKYQMFPTLLSFFFKVSDIQYSFLGQQGHLKCCQHIWLPEIMNMEKLIPFPLFTLE